MEPPTVSEEMETNMDASNKETLRKETLRLFTISPRSKGEFFSRVGNFMKCLILDDIVRSAFVGKSHDDDTCVICIQFSFCG